MAKLWMTIGAVNGFVSVAAGAFGAHGLKRRISEQMLAHWETAARYQMMHALALLAVAALAESRGEAMNGAGWSFTAGIVVFSGSLYVLALTGVTKLGMITPLGGLALLAGWLLVLRASLA
ncbi:MAG: DUF423 domain-containing protein [Polyangiales bacterium]